MTTYNKVEYECDRCGGSVEHQDGGIGGPDGWRRVWFLPKGKPDASTEVEGAYYVHLCPDCGQKINKFMDGCPLQNRPDSPPKPPLEQRDRA